jgi:hypothetical protein
MLLAIAHKLALTGRHQRRRHLELRCHLHPFLITSVLEAIDEIKLNKLLTLGDYQLQCTIVVARNTGGQHLKRGSPRHDA